MTNFESILLNKHRRINIDLVTFIADEIEKMNDCDYCNFLKSCKDYENKSICIKGIKKWLQLEADNNG
jgi:hypothetical protein